MSDHASFGASPRKINPADPGFAIYVHWPFCVRKCPYCDFNSHVRDGVDQDQWRTALLQELDYYADMIGPRDVRSVFFGGGTPSLMPPATTGAILDKIAKRFHMPDHAEVSLEANPSSSEAKRFAGYRAAGVNRLSLGVQALNDKDLEFLGRVHNVDEAMQAITLAHRHFDRLSFDLIYARPNQTMADWREELTAAIDMTRGHLSVYQLTIEEGTGFYADYHKGRFQIPEEDLATDLFDLTQDTCQAAGMPAYEVSNHATPGEECYHNLVYWMGGEWLGIGPGAHGRLNIKGEGRMAQAQDHKPERWLEQVSMIGHGTVNLDKVKPDDLPFELLMMGLRSTAGLSLSHFQKLTGRALKDCFNTQKLMQFEKDGLLLLEGDILRATKQGILLLNHMLGNLLDA